MKEKRLRFATFVKTTVLGVQSIASIFLMAGIILFSEDFNELEPYSRVSLSSYPMVRAELALTMSSLIIWIACLCYMTVAAGRQKESKELQLFSVDRWFIEAELGMFTAWMIFVGFLAYRIHLQSYTIMGRIIVSGCLAFMSDLIFMGFYLSILRMLKAGIGIRNSLLLQFVIHMKRTIGEKDRGNAVILVMEFAVIASGCIGFFTARVLWLILMVVFGVVGIALYLRMSAQHRKLRNGLLQMESHDLNYRFAAEEFTGEQRELAREINQVLAELSRVAMESAQDERMKAELITNISHDLKTPLTSIINYTGLLKRAQIDNPAAREYIDVLEQKSMRLKQMMEDLLDVSRISSGNITLDWMELDLVELVRQTGGEFNERLEQTGLQVVTKFPKNPAIIRADGNQLWRVVGNLYNNLCKYAKPGSRVYADMEVKDRYVTFSIRNLSERKPEVDAGHLADRFVRGDVARSTEGSGLGLSISKMLTELMGGTFRVHTEGEAFEVSIRFPLA